MIGMKKGDGNALIDAVMLAISALGSFLGWLCVGPTWSFGVAFLVAIAASLVVGAIAVATNLRAAKCLQNGLVALSFVLYLLLHSPTHDDGPSMLLAVIVAPTLLVGVALACVSTVRLLDG
jgi:hypothetical protein